MKWGRDVNHPMAAQEEETHRSELAKQTDLDHKKVLVGALVSAMPKGRVWFPKLGPGKLG
jgi:predicted transcriptional regulator